MTTMYAVLGVNPDADRAAIRRAYRDLARRHHPDFGGDVGEMARINEAWHVLGHAERRETYDRQLRRPPRRNSSDGHTVMDWGQYEGWSLADIANVDDNYLHWLSRMPIGRPLQGEIRELLAQRSAAFEARRPAPAMPKRRWSLFSR
jgi:curved DNA-binding protein CbpA